jgi:HEAT repeat protein
MSYTLPDDNEIPFQSVLDALLDTDNVFPPRYLYQFSDMEDDETARLNSIWLQVPEWRRLALVEDLAELGRKEDLLSFETLGRMAISDPEASVRLLAIQILGEFEERDLATLYLKMLRSDESLEVRAAAATALGQYVYAGEIETIPEKLNNQVVEALLATVGGEDADLVRRMALESLGFSSRDEVASLLITAYESGKKEWAASALFAMGRSANEIWYPQVLASLDSKLPAIRQEAARAAGELEIHEARPKLLELLDDPDTETQLFSIWALSQIGGEGVREAIEDLYAVAETEEEMTFLDEALDNLAYTEEVRLLPIIDLPENDVSGEDEDDEDLDWLLDEEYDEEDQEEDEPD